jgi:hypothetical protein
MNGEDVNRSRHLIGDRIGRRLSFSDMSKLVGLSPANGADTFRKWETNGSSGPGGAVLEIMVLGLVHEASDVREFFRGEIVRRLDA